MKQLPDPLNVQIRLICFSNYTLYSLTIIDLDLLFIFLLTEFRHYRVKTQTSFFLIWSLFFCGWKLITLNMTFCLVVWNGGLNLWTSYLIWWLWFYSINKYLDSIILGVIYYLLAVSFINLNNNILSSEHVCAQRLFYYFGKKLIICIHCNLKLLHFSITKNPEVWWVLWDCWWNNFFITPIGILWLKNVIILNYNRYKLLTFSQNNRRVSEHVLKC